MTHARKLRTIAERMASAYRDGTTDPVAGLQYVDIIEARMQHAEHVTLGTSPKYKPSHATAARFSKWAPSVAYSRVPLLGTLPRFYDDAIAHMAMRSLQAVRSRFGSDAVCKRFTELAQAAKRRAVRQIQERIAKARGGAS